MKIVSKNLFTVLCILLVGFSCFLFGSKLEKVSAATVVVPEMAAPKDPYEFRRFAKVYYKGLYPDSISNLSGRTVNINPLYYDTDKIMFYGGIDAVGLFTDLTNDKVRGVSRYIGITPDTFYAFPNYDFKFDYGTTGEVLARSYVENLYANRNSVKNNSFKPYTNSYNDIAGIQSSFGYFRDILLEDSEARQIRQDWVDSIDDKYAYDHDVYRANSGGYFKRTNTGNEFMDMTASERYGRIFIAVPPTEYSSGLGVAFHDVGNRNFYDGYNLDPLIKDNFRATKLEIKEVGDGVYEVYFSVKNEHGRNVDTQIDIETLIDIEIGGVKVPIEPLDINTDFGSVWKKDEVKKSLIIPAIDTYELAPNTPIKVTANFNHLREGQYLEKSYSDNKLSTTVYTAANPTCGIGGTGSYKEYQIRQSYCSGDSCYSYCSSRYAYLSHSAKLEYDNTKQTLLGTWSKNSKGHKDMESSVPDAKDALISDTEFKLTTVKDHKVPGINKLKRVIRAGRDVMMHSTMELDLKITSFDSFSDVDKRKDAFVDHLIDSLESKGVNVDSGVVKNFENKGKAKAKVDPLRNIKVLEEKKLGVESFGDSSCLVIKRYTKTYKIRIPIATSNEGGIQKTSQGDFSLSPTYKIKDAVTSFYTDINNINGIKGIRLTGELDGTKLDPSLSSKKYCDSRTEKFGIQGNIYDDIISEDVKNDTDNDWDF